MDIATAIGSILTQTLFTVGGVSIPVWSAVAAGAALLIIMIATGRKAARKDDPSGGFGDRNNDGA